ncbi:M3 family metallopeptidase [Hydrogenimonas cancrithermarum]|uniref:oligopeptidase A n=1 Tax=Hydrogenimonas cancrithermarum TaxID=2993563 RepID=A0ABM8FIA6_9BACT|nr:M3 family metallopeptidase [Hydrogenimonas cancrithermarum]BDY11998.1 oligopeptidase A [Hydrogenimonas cancrithermarum]
MFVPFTSPDFDKFPDALKALLEENESSIKSLLQEKKRDYRSFVRPYMETFEKVDLFFTPLAHLNSVENSKRTQQAYEASLPLLSHYHTKLSQNRELFEAFSQITGEDRAQQEVVRQELRDFRLSGVDLPEKKKKRLETIDLRLSELNNHFSQNLLDATNAYELIIEDPKDVEGVPESDLELAKTEKEGKTVWKFTLQIPSYMAYMTYGPNRSLREELYRAYVTRAPKNQAIIDEILRLRDEKAKILGFDHFSELSLATKMAPKDEAVIGFLNELADAALPHAEKEVEKLQALAKEDGIEELESYDVAYYSEKLKKRDLDFDDEMTRPYFEQGRVLQGLLDFVSELFGISFEPVDVPVWNEKVKVFDLQERGETFARIYFDLEARKNKRGGAWMNDWQTHHEDEKGAEHPASAFVVCNFQPSTQATPSLLRHDDVVTLFHEMGHAIHHLFSKVKERFVSGIHGVEWDAVEFPSQFLENFAYERSVLERFARHHETGRPMPETLMRKIKQSKNFLAAMGILRQIEFALFDFMLHQKLYQGDEIQALLDTLRARLALIKPPSYNRFQWGFAHIFAGGYAAGYYSYKWAEVLSADAFFACFDSGRIRTDRMDGYKHYILERGASEPMQELYREWLGRGPDPKALMKLYDLVDAR